MALMHHDGLRVNAPAVDDDEAMEIYVGAGWAPGPHADTDPDDPAEIPRVLPKPEPPAAKATSKKAS